MATKIVRPLTLEERTVLQEELLSNYYSEWGTHSTLKTSALKSGKSIHLNLVTSRLKFMYSKFELFPKTHSILKEIANNRSIARCYWHRLLPGDTIVRHTDEELWFVENNKLHARYQIYLDCPMNSAVIDDANCNMRDYEYTLVNFDLLMPHSYHNEGNRPWHFLVFDVLNGIF